MINWIVGCILIMPWVVLPIPGLREQFRTPKAVFFDIICMGVILYTIRNGVKYIYQNKTLFWLSVWVFFTIFWNWYSPIMWSSQEGIQFQLWTLENTLHFIFGLITIFCICSSIEQEDFIRIAKAICLSAVCVSIIGIMQVMMMNPFQNVLKYTADMHISAFLDNPNLVAYYLCVSIPFFLYFKKLKYYIGLGIVLIAFYFANSDISKIALLGSISVIYLLNFRGLKYRLFYLIPILLGLVLLYFNQDLIKLHQRLACRLEVWTLALPYLKQNPLFGQGLGVWKTWTIIFRDTYWFEAHNDWLERTCEIGFLGIGLFVTVIINSIRKFNYSPNNKLGFAYLASFISFLILMLGGFPMEVAPVSLIALLSFCAIERLGE